MLGPQNGKKRTTIVGDDTALHSHLRSSADDVEFSVSNCVSPTSVHACASSAFTEDAAHWEGEMQDADIHETPPTTTHTINLHTTFTNPRTQDTLSVNHARTKHWTTDTYKAPSPAVQVWATRDCHTSESSFSLRMQFVSEGRLW